MQRHTMTGLLAVLFAIAPLAMAEAQLVPLPGDTPQRVEFYPAGQKGIGTPVTLSFVGQIYKPETASRATTPDERFVMRIVAVNATGTLDEMLQLWDTAERDDVRRMASNPSNWDANRKLYAAMTGTSFVARMEYGEYLIFFVKHALTGRSPIVQTYTLRRAGPNTYALTNKLSADPVLVYWSNAYTRQLQ